MAKPTEQQLDLAERVFSRFGVMYGTKFLDLWRGLDRAEVIEAWAHELAAFHPRYIKSAIESLKLHNPFPPSLPEFLALCDKARARQPYEMSDFKRLPNFKDLDTEETRSARDRCMATMARLKLQGPPNKRHWMYNAIRAYNVGKKALSPEALAIVNRALEIDAGANDPLHEQQQAAE